MQNRTSERVAFLEDQLVEICELIIARENGDDQAEDAPRLGEEIERIRDAIKAPWPAEKSPIDLRDLYAAHALAGFLTHNGIADGEEDAVLKRCWTMADAMIALKPPAPGEEEIKF